MANIDLNNYEAFLLDYSEGNLDGTQIEELKNFLILNPTLDVELEDLVLPFLQKVEENFEFKTELQKSTDDVYDDTLLNYLENNLSQEEKELFENKLQSDSSLAAEFTAYKKTILSQDLELHFHAKADLLKTEDDTVLLDRSIAYLEGTLSAEERISFELDLLVKPSVRADLELTNKTKIAADQKIIHPDKASLKKQNRIIYLFDLRAATSMAAAILLLLGLAFVFKWNQRIDLNRPDVAASNRSSVEKQKVKSDKKSIVNNAALAQTTKKLISTFPLPTIVPPSDDTASVAEKSDPQITKNESSTQYTSSTVPIIVVPEFDHDGDSATSNSPLAQIIEPSADDDIEIQIPDKESRLWKRAVNLAKRANNMGIRSIDGQMDSKNNYRISFLSFSVEKK